MKKVILIMLVIAFSLNVTAQFPFGSMSSVKVKIKKGIAYVEKTEYIRVTGTDFETDHSYYTLNSDEEFAYTKVVEYTDPNHWDGSNDPHSVEYWELHFPGVDDYLEIDITLQQLLIAEFYNNGIIAANGSLDTAKVKKYIKKKGKDYTRRREEIQNTPQPEKIIIIENRTTTPQPQPVRNRVGVRVGGVNVEVHD